MFIISDRNIITLAICRNGYKGALKVGLYDFNLLSLNTKTDKLVNTYETNITDEATLTRESKSNKSDMNIINPVIIIATNGISFLFVFVKNSGNKPSLAKAKGYLDEASIPAFAVVINAKEDARVIKIYPGLPKIIEATSDTGVSEDTKLASSNTPVKTTSTNT